MMYVLKCIYTSTAGNINFCKDIYMPWKYAYVNCRQCKFCKDIYIQLENLYMSTASNIDFIKLYTSTATSMEVLKKE